MALIGTGTILGNDIVNYINSKAEHGELSDEAREMWIDIADIIVKHVTNNSVITGQTIVTGSSPSGAVTGVGTMSNGKIT